MISAWWLLLVPVFSLALFWYCGVFPPIRFNRHTVAVAIAAVAGLAVLTGPGVFASCVIAGCVVAAFALCLEI